jgi:hypothetical protein
MKRQPKTAPSAGGAVLFYFNDPEIPFPLTEKILVDAGIFVALFDNRDHWHSSVVKFLKRYYLDAEFGPKFYVTPDIVKFTQLTTKELYKADYIGYTHRLLLLTFSELII